MSSDIKPAPIAFGQISIVICTRGRRTDLANTLKSLSEVQVPQRWSPELLVVENCMKEGAETLASSFAHDRIRARYLFEPTPGKSRTLNRAISAATGDILLFTDDDVRFPADWVEMMCEPIAAGRADAVAGGVRLAAHLLRPWMNHTHRAWLASTADYLSPDRPSEMCGANMAISRRVLDQIGGFDPELGPGITGGGEESLLSWQIKQAGFCLAGAPDVQVEHHLDPERLLYQSWLTTARLKGWTRAYQLHHWFHQRIRFAWFKRFAFRAKLLLRRCWSRKRRSASEGIDPWELSYLEEIAKFDRYMRERRRPANYPIQT